MEVVGSWVSESLKKNSFPTLNCSFSQGLVLMTRSIVEGLLDVLEDQRKEVRALFSLTDDQLNWVPQKSRNCIANLIEHITGAEAYWIQEVVMGTPVGRVRDNEFQYRYRSKKELQNAYEYMAKATMNILQNKLTDEMLFDQRKAREQQFSIHWILLHMVEHNYYHIGQMNYIRGLLGTDSFISPPED